MNDNRRGSTFTNARALFSFSYVRIRLSLAPRKLRAHGRSVESRTRTVSSHITLARESRRMPSARVYSRHTLISAYITGFFTLSHLPFYILVNGNQEPDLGSRKFLVSFIVAIMSILWMEIN